MDIQDIINNIAAGENNAAKEGLEHVLSAKAFDALQGYKQEIAATLYGGQEQESEEDTDYEEDEEEVAYAESVEHDDNQEQLDELSKATLKNYEKKSHASYQAAVDSKQDAANRANVIVRGGGNIEYHDKRKDQYDKAAKIMKKRTAGIVRAWDRT